MLYLTVTRRTWVKTASLSSPALPGDERNFHAPRFTSQTSENWLIVQSLVVRKRTGSGFFQNEDRGKPKWFSFSFSSLAVFRYSSLPVAQNPPPREFVYFSPRANRK